MIASFTHEKSGGEPLQFKCKFENCQHENRVDGYLKIDGQWTLVSPQSPDDETTQSEFRFYIENHRAKKI